jgi:MFS family permease
LFKEKNGTYSSVLFSFSFIHGIVAGIWAFLSVFLLDIGGTAFHVGLLAFMPGLASTFMQLAWGRLGDKVGTTWKMVSTGFLFAALFSVPVIFSTKPWQVILATSAQALLASISEVAITVRFAEVLEPSRRARFMGVYNPLNFAGTIVGSLIAGLFIPSVGYRYIFLSYTILNLVIAGMIRFGLSTQQEKDINYLTLLKMAFQELKAGLKELPQLGKDGGPYTRWCVGISVRGFGIAMFGPILTLYLVNILKATKPQIGTLNSVAFLVRLIGTPPLGVVVDREGPKRVMLIGFFLAAMHPLVFTFAPEVAYLVPVYILSGVYWAFINSAWFAWQMNLIPARRGVYAGYFAFINGISWAFGPLLGGYLGDAASLGLSATLSCLLVLAGLLILLKVPEKAALEAVAATPSLSEG